MFSSNLSNLSEGVDTAFIVILSVIFFFLIGLTATLIVFIIRYREKKNPVASQIHGNTKLELIWTLIPLLLVIGMFYFGWTGWKPMESSPPKDAMQIETTARMWNWMFKYKNGQMIDTLVIPAGKPVSLNMTALDVIHSLYIPAFRLKKDVVPGTPRNAWFIANSPGVYDLFCTEYCGLEHSTMITTVHVLSQEDFDAWYANSKSVATTTIEEKAESGASLGKDLYQKIGCFACHSIDGTKIVGPSFKGIFGHEVTVLTNDKERTIKVDEDYIRSSIIDPNADIVQGFNKGLMLSYKDQLTEEQIDLIIEYIKSLN